jgi:hypothetical protein
VAQHREGVGAITSRRTRGLSTSGRSPLSSLERRSMVETERRRAAGLIGQGDVVTVAQLLREEGQWPSQ